MNSWRHLAATVYRPPAATPVQLPAVIRSSRQTGLSTRPWTSPIRTRTSRIWTISSILAQTSSCRRPTRWKAAVIWASRRWTIRKSRTTSTNRSVLPSPRSWVLRIKRTSCSKSTRIVRTTMTISSLAREAWIKLSLLPRPIAALRI